jgi:hypothetical protein
MISDNLHKPVLSDSPDISDKEERKGKRQSEEKNFTTDRSRSRHDGCLHTKSLFFFFWLLISKLYFTDGLWLLIIL